jgi:hypothetical protein
VAAPGGAIAAIAPANTVAPVASGSVSIGGTLSCSTGTWSGQPAPTLTYQWRRDGVNIALATNSTYTPVAADITPTAGGDTEGPDITCRVTATSVAGVAAADSNALTYSPLTSLGSGLKGWWRGDLGYDGTTLLDQTANDWDLTQGTAARRPGTRSINGITALDFDGSDDRIAASTNTSSFLGTPGLLETVVVFQADALVAGTNFSAAQLLGQDTNNFWAHTVGASALYGLFTNAAGVGQAAAALGPAAAAPATGTTYRSRHYADGTNVNAKLGSGTVVSTGCVGADATSYTGNKLLIGWNASQNAFFNGAWCEGFVFVGTMTSAQRADLDAWVARWAAQT